MNSLLKKLLLRSPGTGRSVPESDIAELESEVCARITMFTVKDLVSKLKRDRAPGYSWQQAPGAGVAN